MGLGNFKENPRMWIAIGSTVALGVAYLTTRSSGGESDKMSSQTLSTEENAASAPTNTHEFGGQTWYCMSMNNSDTVATYDASKPTVKVPLDAMRNLNDMTPPFLIIRGADGPLKIEQTFSEEFRRVANGALICVDGI